MRIGRLRTLATAFAIALAACQPTPPSNAVVFEGARLIDGNGAAPIEDSAFIVENNLFTWAGRRADVQAPATATRVDLRGKTVMPALIDLHGHIGFQNIAEGTMSKEMYTRENLVDHLELLAYNGVGAVIGVGDLVSRSDLHGGRTNWGDVPLRVRDEVVAGAALFKTAGPGIAWPGSGAQGHPSRVDVSYPITTVEEARAAVRDYAAMKPAFIKIWVDDRGGTKKTLTPELYRAVAEEAHRYNLPVGVHNVTLANAKELMRAGVEGWLHVPVRAGEAADEELIAIVKDRIAKNDRPKMWMTPSLITQWMNTQGGTRPAWLDDPLLQAAYSPADIEQHWGEPLRKMTARDVAAARQSFDEDARNAMRLRAAGKNADFIVLNANPLDNISNTRTIDKVFLRGKEVDRAALRARWQRSRKVATE